MQYQPPQTAMQTQSQPQRAPCQAQQQQQQQPQPQPQQRPADDASRKRALSAGDPRTAEHRPAQAATACGGEAGQPAAKRRCISRDGAKDNDVFARIKEACAARRGAEPCANAAPRANAAPCANAEPCANAAPCANANDGADESGGEWSSCDSEDDSNMVSPPPREPTAQPPPPVPAPVTATVASAPPPPPTQTRPATPSPQNKQQQTPAQAQRQAPRGEEAKQKVEKKESDGKRAKKEVKRSATRTPSKADDDDEDDEDEDDSEEDDEGGDDARPAAAAVDDGQPREYNPTRAQFKEDKKKRSRLRLMKHLSRYMPQRACGRCEACRKPPCGECKNCAYNATIADTHKSKKRCMALKCDRVKVRDHKYEVDTTAEFRLLLAQLSALEQVRIKNATQQVASYKSGKNQRAEVHRVIREAAELAMGHIVREAAETVLIDDASRTERCRPYFMKHATAHPAGAVQSPPPPPPQPQPTQTMNRAAPK